MIPLLGSWYLLALDHGHRDGLGGGARLNKATPANGVFSYFSNHFNYSRVNSTSVGGCFVEIGELPAFVLISND